MTSTSTTPTDTALVAAFKAGDETAFTALVNRYHAPMLAFAERLLNGNRADAEDAVSKVMSSAYGGLSRFRGDASLKWWLFRITRNETTQIMRGNRHQRLSVDIDDCPALIDWDQPSIQCQVQLNEYEEACNRIINGVTSNRRAAMELSMTGVPQRQVARMLGKSRSTVRTQIEDVQCRIAAKVPRERYLDTTL